MSTIDLNQLSPEQRKDLEAQLKKQKKAEKQKRAQDLQAFKTLSENFVSNNIDKLIHHHEITGCFIEELWKGYEVIRELKADIYGNKVIKQDSHTSTLADGSASITIGWNVSIGFDGTESEGVTKIKDFIASLSTDDEKNRKLSAMVNTFLKPNAKTGMLNPVKIIELSKMKSEFNDERFDEGLEIIFNAQQRRQNSMYVSGWKFVEVKGIPKKVEFRFTL